MISQNAALFQKQFQTQTLDKVRLRSQKEQAVVQAMNKHQAAYYDPKMHPMNVWLYPSDLHSMKLARAQAEQKAIQNQLEQSQAQTAQAIQPQSKFLSLVAADFDGEGRLQFQNGDIYQGMFVKGKMEGQGTLRTLNGDTYIGAFKNGFKHGKGKMIYVSGNNAGGSYEGDWAYNKKEGNGLMIDANGDRYEGAFLGNSRHGEGNQVYAKNGARYVGLWQNNLPYKGKLFLTDGTMFEGDWKDDMFSGVGSINFANGDNYQGEWKNFEPHRYGVRAYRNGRVYTGEWQGGQRHGNGSMQYPNGDKYEGSWLFDMRSGFGKFQLKRGDVYEGEWLDDAQHGRGKLTHYEGSVFEGDWVNGEQVTNGGVYTNPTTGVQLKTNDYRLKEQYRKPSEYLVNTSERMKAIQVDSAYFNQTPGMNPNQMTSTQGVLRAQGSGIEIQRYLQEQPQPIVYKPSPLRFSGQQQLSSKLLAVQNGPQSHSTPPVQQPLSGRMLLTEQGRGSMLPSDTLLTSVQRAHHRMTESGQPVYIGPPTSENQTRNQGGSLSRRQTSIGNHRNSIASSQNQVQHSPYQEQVSVLSGGSQPYKNRSDSAQQIGTIYDSQP